MAVTETHLDDTVDDSAVAIEGYNGYRFDRKKYGGSVVFYIQSHIPVKIRNYLGMSGIEALWIQVHIPYRKPILACCC